MVVVVQICGLLLRDTLYFYRLQTGVLEEHAASVQVYRLQVQVT
jgi:hypothetical protein